ncbi:PREDICTED: anthocyanidin reductase ((2S)-flavan-3-ol-forming)-like [Amphimedon queenslandica]|uniref:NAD-dependent epimerase/dehydratase domain-containing protein n=1 Tax=Amphimedon queenslandica TaxID=400682 RepID=A0A1X7VC77_AMPQE|nr:PREDICTED: anthocyanidin reductase ((2S)-flavan-3-ol-forming)-like [Amphimedon queenslandica]|eukprot:XP_003385061.1 PREDICTED: anthocyanidin reductase ((2S)-flavan-3-ol-forming)-like [Amphimedon queenslandica]
MSEENQPTLETAAPVEEAPQQAEPVAAKPEDNRPLVLVTGASGFIAAHVIKQLAANGKYRIRGTVRDATNEAKTKPIRELPGGDTMELVSANLTSEEEWKAAVKGCTYVLHVASPFPLKKPKNEDEVILPAREGALNVLKACAEEAGSPDRQLKRVVLVSSIAAVSNGLVGPSGTYSEENWSDETKIPPYEKSKLLAERASWEFVEKLEDGKKFEFSVVNPAVVFGPPLNASSGSGSSLSLITNVIGNKVPGIPNLYVPYIDVRDVAAGLIAAMEKPEAAGKRYLLANEEPPPYLDMAQAIADEFEPQGYKVPAKPMNKVLLWVAALLDEGAKLAKSYQGIEIKYNISRMVGELGITPIPYKTCVLDTCYGLIDHGLIRKTPQYLGHPDNRPPPQEPEAEEPKAEETKAEEPKAEEPKSEEPKAEEPKVEEPKAEEPKAEEPKAEEPKAEEPKAEEPKAEEPKAEEPKAEEPKAEEPKAEEPKAEEPKAEEPKAEEPKAEEPKAEEPKAEEPKAEEPKAEEPKAEEPKAEEPKAEETEEPAEGEESS